MRIRGALVAVALAAVSCGDDNNKNEDAAQDLAQDTAQDLAPADAASDASSSALTLNDEGCADFLQQDSFPNFQLEMSTTEWAALQSEFSNWQQRQAAGQDLKPFHPAVFKLGSETVADAAVRLTGATWTWTGKKMPLLVAFDQKNPAGRFHGLRALELQAPPQDRTLMRSRLALAVLRAAGIPAQCAANARLDVNGAFYGVFASVEPLDQGFVDRSFPGAANGNLLAYGWDPLNGPIDWTRVVQFNAAQDAASIGRLCDLDESVREWAWEAVIPQGNGFWGVGQSFALYDNPDRGFQYIPYDLNVSLDQVPSTADPVFWTGAWVMGPPDKFLAVVHDPVWGAKYAEAVAAATAEYVPATLKSWIDAWERQIGAAIDQDPNKGFATSDHADAVVMLRAYVSKRATHLASWNQCMAKGDKDSDGDGVPWCRDCNDKNAAVHPGAQEICGNRIDDDCNGRIDDGCPGVDGGWIPPTSVTPADAGGSN